MYSCNIKNKTNTDDQTMNLLIQFKFFSVIVIFVTSNAHIPSIEGQEEDVSIR